MRRIPFFLAMAYVVIGEVVACWMFSQGLLFEVNHLIL
jgi:hypothetical protein